jgi:hypothetical protein
MNRITLIFSLLFSGALFAQNGLDFDGINDYVSAASGGPTGAASRTVECWVKTSSSISTQQVIVDWGEMSPNGSRFTLNMINFGKVRIEVGGNGFNSTASIADGNWHHIAVTYDNNAALKFKVYIDGVLDGNQNTTVAVNTSATGGFQIGRRNDAINYFDGIIDEVRVWNVVRTQTEIQSAMNSEFCAIPAGLVAYYKFNEGVAGGTNTGVTTAINAVGSNNGTLSGFALTGSSSNWVGGKSLTSGSTTPGNTSITVCDSYTANTGAVWTTSGNYVDTISSATGCDSILNIALTINQSSTGSLTTTACNKYVSPSGNNVWTTSGTYTDVLTNAVGCDSVLAINLTVNTVDTSVLQNGIVLTSWATGATYQWLDCGNGYAPVAGATNQTFTPTANGSYAVQLDNNGCMDTSACYTVTGIGFEESNAAGDFIIFPNPATDVLNIAFVKNTAATEITLLDLSGRALVTQTVEENSAETNISVSALPAGLYLLNLNKDGKSAVFRIEVM